MGSWALGIVHKVSQLQVSSRVIVDSIVLGDSHAPYLAVLVWAIDDQGPRSEGGDPRGDYPQNGRANNHM